jgi:hypothetical protein
MKLFTVLLIILFAKSSQLQFEKELAPDYNRGIEYLDENKALFNKFLAEDADKAILVSVVFPEIVRYSLIRDLLETKSLEIGYVSKGSEFVDFSIGRFQMKPSFLESIEHTLSCSPSIKKKYPAITQYSSLNKKTIRRERLARLQSLQWQLRYLQAFYDILLARHAFLEQKSMGYKVKFFATAYNHGYLSNRAEIEQWMDKETYPWGTGIKGRQYAYSHVAVYFFNNHYKSIFNQ